MGFNSKNNEHRAVNVPCMFNVLPLIDHMNGTWVTGTNGDDILVGGFHHHSGILSVANAGKTALGLHMWCAVGNRYQSTTGHIYETEGTMPTKRVTQCSLNMNTGTPFDMTRMENDEDPRFMMIDGTSLKLDSWADQMTEERDIRHKQRGVKKYEVTLPWELNSVRKNKMVKPMIVLLDSASEAEAESSIKLTEENGTDDKKGQTSFMRDGWVKTKVYGHLMAGLCSRADIFVISTASLDAYVDMNTAPGRGPEKTMAHLGANKKMKGLGTSYKKLTTNIFQFGQPKPLFKGTASSDKLPKYPANKEDYYLDNKDLEEVILQNVRGKGSGSGMSFPLVRSQRLGVLPDVTELRILTTWGNKEIQNYGISDAGQYQYTLDLYPELKFRNTNFRETSANSYEFRRALELTFGMKMEIHAKQSPEFDKYRCTPAELYKDIKELGYDWNILLKSRGYWQFLEEEDPNLPYLSILMLMKLRCGATTLSWYPQPK